MNDDYILVHTLAVSSNQSSKSTDILVISHVHHHQRNKISSMLVQLASLAIIITKIEMKVEITNWEK